MRTNQPALYDARGHELASSSERWPQECLPEIVEMPNERMAVAHTVGDPDRVMHLVVPALYSSVYKLNCYRRLAGKDFKLGHLRARWPDAGSEPAVPRDEWRGVWGLPIPCDTTSLPVIPLPPSFSHFAVEVETWEYGTVAQLTHRGLSSDEQADVERLKEFIAQSGCEIAGPLEEEYLAGPEPTLQKSVVRFRVRRSDLVLIGPAAMDVGARG